MKLRERKNKRRRVVESSSSSSDASDPIRSESSSDAFVDDSSTQRNITRPRVPSWKKSLNSLVPTESNDKPTKKMNSKAKPEPAESITSVNASEIASITLDSERIERRSRADDELWIDKYRPVTEECVCINPRKRLELKAWLEDFSRNVLILTGPSGSAKTTCLSVLGQSLNFAVSWWTDSRDYSRHFGTDYSESKMHQFSLFLRRSVSSGGLSNLSFQRRNRLVVIEEIPWIRDATFHTRFLESVSNALRASRRAKLVFVFAVEYENQSMDTKVFPKSFVEEWNIDKISFNAVSPTYLKKALKSILEQEHLNLSKDMIQSFIDLSRGDLRFLINSLQFETRTTLLNDKVSAVDERDHYLSRFHTVGKVLYGKSYEKLDEILATSSMPPQSLLDYLYENAYEFLSTREQDLPNFAELADGFSQADMLTTASYLESSISIENRLQKEMGALISTHTFHRLKLHDQSLWSYRAIRFPKFFSLNQRQRTLAAQLEQVRTHAPSCWSSLSATALFVQVIPYPMCRFRAANHLAALASLYTQLSDISELTKSTTLASKGE